MQNQLEKHQTIGITIEYNGSDYRGWQRQESQPTVQLELEKALFQILGHTPTLHVAGRTDAGVHAIGQRASFTTHHRIEARRLAPALNHYLPASISVRQSETMPADFNARFASISKHYQYRIFNGRQRSALNYKKAWHIIPRLHCDSIREASQELIGTHDFNAFRSTQCDAPHARRHMYNISIEEQSHCPDGPLISINLHANAFCRYMCRIIVGTLAEVGQGKRKASSIQEILEKKQRCHAGVTAPPYGLTLMQVYYSEEETNATA